MRNKTKNKIKYIFIYYLKRIRMKKGSRPNMTDIE